MAEFPQLDVPERSILVASQGEAELSQLLAIAEPLARSEPPRELILGRLVRPPRGASARGALQTEDRLLREASDEVTMARLELMEQGVAARAVAFTSADPGGDLVKLADSEEVDLLLVDGRRPLLGEGVPPWRRRCRAARCAVRCGRARGAGKRAGGDGSHRPVVIPFGGAEHDWAALELGAWLAAATGAPLQLLGAAGQSSERVTGDAAPAMPESWSSNTPVRRQSR